MSVGWKGLAAGLLISASLLVAAVDGVRPARADERIIQICDPWEVTTLDPTKVGYVYSRMAIGETLVTVDPRSKALVPMLAESWELSADQLEWRFHLRPGVLFHDGTALTAEIVVAALLRAKENAGSFKVVPIEAIVADGNDVVIRTRDPFSTLPAHLADYYTTIVAPGSFAADGTVQAMIGTGPYEVTAITGTTQIDAVVFDRYWGPKPAIAQARYRGVPLGETRANLAEAGETHLTFSILPQVVDRLVASDRVDVVSVTIGRTRSINLDLARPQFADPQVRKALALAIDRAAIASAILKSPLSAATQLMPPSISDWHDPDLNVLRYDPDEARALLDAAGWLPGPDGIRVKDGQRLEATLMILAARPELPVIAQAVQAQFAEIGVALALEPVDNFALVPEAQKNGTFEAVLINAGYTLIPDPVGALNRDFGQDQPTWGAYNYRNDELRALFRRYQATFDDKDRAGIRHAILAILHEDMPILPIAWTELTVAVSKELDPASVVIDPFEIHSGIRDARWAD